MSEFETTGGLETTDAPTGAGKKEQAKQMIGQAGQALKTEAQSFAQTAQERARSEAQKRTEEATHTLGVFANAIRRAGDELGEADQSPAARLVRQAADGLEGLATNLAGKQPEDLLNDVRAFGRKNPVAFIGGAVLIGVALGRFVRASEAAANEQPYGGAPLTGEVGGEPFPLTETPAYPASAAATGAVATGLAAEEDTFDGDPELSGARASGGLEGAIGDDLGDLTPSDVTDSTSVTDTGPSTPERREP